LFFVISFSLFAELTPDEEKKYDETEGIKFLEQLVQDQKYQDAIELFKTYKPSKKNQTKYNLLTAKSFYHLKRFSEAKQTLENTTTDFNQEYYLLRGLVSYELKNYEGCTTLLKRSQPMGVETYLKCLKLTKRESEIYNTINTLQATNENEHILKIKYLLDLKLFEEAKINIIHFSKNCPSLSSLLEVLEQSNIYKLKISEQYERIHYCYPDQAEATAPFIKELFYNEQKISLQLQFQKLANLDAIYYQHSSEFLKHSGYIEASYFQHILNPDFKSYQQFKIQKSLEDEQLIKTSTFRPETQENLYALAYAHFLTNNAEQSINVLNLKKIRNDQENRLLELSKQCLKADWRCRP
jgi:hypothetical protein